MQKAKAILEAAGYEVLVFHSTGIGGRTMESLIESGLVAGVLDITTTEWADELVGGFLGAGSTRLEARGTPGRAGHRGAPAVSTWSISTPRTTVPAKFAGRTFYHHNPQVTLMRTTPRGVRPARPHPGGESEPLPWSGYSVAAEESHQRDQRRGPALS
ncbi:MAG: Tm-1-like ATP-binding domain-containing protein [Chthoniobacter sp.]